MKRAYSYIRFSKKHQANGDSLRRQLAGSAAYCERKGLQLDEGFCLQDLGVSAWNGKNAAVGALGAFLEAVRTGRVPRGSVLIIESLDRLSRSQIDDAFELFRQLLKAGIDITTLQPEREYTRESIRDIGGLLEPLFIMSRAHEESETKSARLRAAWDAKRKAMAERPATRQCPAWLRLKEDRSAYEKIAEKVAVVLRIYRLAREGHGSKQIVRRLTTEGVANISNGTRHWCPATITCILRTRAVLGEYQPKIYRDGKSIPQGPPVKNYFPPIMSEKDWRATRRAVELRQNQRGPQGQGVRNLFTELVFDARDGRTMHVTTKGKKKRISSLVSSAAMNGEAGSKYITFPYELLEHRILGMLSREETAGLLRKQPNGREQEMEALAGELVSLDRRIRATRQRLEAHPDYESLLDALVSLEDKKKATSEALNALRTQQASNDTETLGEARHIWGALRDCPPEELVDLRTRLKARIRALIEEVWVLVQGTRKDKWVALQVFFRNGKYLLDAMKQHPEIQMHNIPGSNPPLSVGFGADVLFSNKTEGIPAVRDLRQWRKLADPSSFQFPPRAWMLPPDQRPRSVLCDEGIPALLDFLAGRSAGGQGPQK